MPGPPASHALHGWLVLDKPRGLGSTDAVAAVKRALRAAGYPRVKVGHGGTLDTLAHGVLPIALGEATKLAGRMLDASKAYSFTVAFGAETDTLDLDGEVIATSDVRPTLAEVKAVLPDFLGPIDQLPPSLSTTVSSESSVSSSNTSSRTPPSPVVEMAAPAACMPGANSSSAPKFKVTPLGISHYFDELDVCF